MRTSKMVVAIGAAWMLALPAAAGAAGHHPHGPRPAPLPVTPPASTTPTATTPAPATSAPASPVPVVTPAPTDPGSTAPSTAAGTATPAATTLATTAAPSGATAYGISELSLDGFASSSSFHTLCGWNGSSCGHGGLSLGYARMQVPYNVLGTYDTTSGTCVSTATDANNWTYHLGSQENWPQVLHDWLAAAARDGLRPLVTLQSGNPNLTSEANNPSRPTLNGYKCGFAALLQATAPGGSDAEVHEWEAFNEPDGGLCASTGAAFYVAATQVAAANNRSGDTLVAGVFKDGDDPLDGRSHPDCGHGSGNWYVRDYVSAIQAAGLNPAVWSWHPYRDVDSTYAGPSAPQQTQDLASYLNTAFPSHPAFWLTETGVYLNDPAYGQYLDGSPSAQANAAAGFLNLAAAPNQAYPGQIARTYWYEYETYGDGSNQGGDHWDSALVGLTNIDWMRNGTGVPRASYCVLAYHDSPAQAVQDSRCDGSSGPQVPWSDWEDPTGG